MSCQVVLFSPSENVVQCHESSPISTYDVRAVIRERTLRCPILTFALPHDTLHYSKYRSLYCPYGQMIYYEKAHDEAKIPRKSEAGMSCFMLHAACRNDGRRGTEAFGTSTTCFVYWFGTTSSEQAFLATCYRGKITGFSIVRQGILANNSWLRIHARATAFPSLTTAKVT